MTAEQAAQVVGIQQGGGRTLVTVQHERPAPHLHTFPASRLPALPALGAALTLPWMWCPHTAEGVWSEEMSDGSPH